MKKLLLFIIVCALIGGAYVYMGSTNDTKKSTQTTQQSTQNAKTQTEISVKENTANQPTNNEIAKTQEKQEAKTVQNNEVAKVATENNTTTTQQETIKTVETQKVEVSGVEQKSEAEQEIKTSEIEQKIGLSIDPATAKVIFESFKMPNKMKVPEIGGYATFKNAEFNFLNTSGTVSEILANATVKIDLNSVDTQKNQIRDNNIKTNFFTHLTNQEANAKILSVNGDKDSGKIILLATLNGVDKEIELKYEIKEGKITAMGEIDLTTDFNAKEAFDKFANNPVIAGLHGKKSWPNINIGFEISTK